MASSTETAKAYFAALSEHDVDAALALWSPAGSAMAGGPGVVGVRIDEERELLEDLFATFPDWQFEILETTTYRERCAVRWRAVATFAGPRRLHGYAPNGRRLALEGCDVLTIKEGQILDDRVYMDRAAMLRQLGLLAPEGSSGERARAAWANLRSGIRRRMSGGEPQVIAPGVWLLRGHAPGSMNVYLIAEPDGGVTVFDAGPRLMGPAIAAGAAALGGLRRCVLGHADADHRGGVAGLGVEIFCHAAERDAAEAPGPTRDYWDLSKLDLPARLSFPNLLRFWDGGPLTVAGTLSEGDTVADFSVVELPGHAPGLIGLFREEDGLAICSDVLYTLDPQTGISGEPRLPHEAFDFDSEGARASLMKLAGLAPKVVWVGHSHPVSGPDVVEQLIRVAQG